jgi:glycosyltransferase involved in cell wall biosynthesis
MKAESDHVLNGQSLMPALKVFAIGMHGAANDGGLERYYFELLKALPAAGSDPRGLVLGRADGSCEGGAAVSSFAHSTDPVLRQWRMMRAVSGTYIADADIVVSHFALNAFPITRALRKRPFVVHFHGPWALESLAEGDRPWKTPLKSFIERRVYSSADRLIVLSQAFGEILQKNYGVRPELIRVVRGGVNLDRFHALAPRTEARERLGWPTDRPIITTARRLLPSKGIENLIDAIVEVRRSSPNVLTNILGAGPLQSDLERRVVERGLSEHVFLRGRVSDEDLALAYRASDLFVVPSIALEGFGLVIVESLAAGTPALVTDVGGLPEVVRSLDPGLVLDGTGPDAIARGIVAALDGTLSLPTEAECIAYAARFDWKTVATDVHAVYSEAMK